MNCKVSNSGGPLSDIAIFVINLDRSVERWVAVQRQADIAGISLNRISGVDGWEIRSSDRVNLDEGAFVRRNGRLPLPGEYGCYLAHLKALKVIADSNCSAAVVVEDDVEIAFDIIPRIRAILAAAPQADVVKLLSHRVKGFREWAVTEHNDRIGRCLHGPQGSAACYLVTRDGAEKLLQALHVIEFPFDMALERGWKTKLNVLTLQRNLLQLSERSLHSQIASREEYRKVKVRGARKLITHVLRAVDYAKRIRYALS